MMDEPMAPGRGLAVYQPATLVVVGTWSAPALVVPSLISLVLTPIAGMIRYNGSGADEPTAGPGTGAIGPCGTATRRVGPAAYAPRSSALAPMTPIPPASVTSEPTSAAMRLRRADRLPGAAWRPVDSFISPCARVLATAPAQADQAEPDEEQPCRDDGRPRQHCRPRARRGAAEAGGRSGAGQHLAANRVGQVHDLQPPGRIQDHQRVSTAR